MAMQCMFYEIITRIWVTWAIFTNRPRIWRKIFCLNSKQSELKKKLHNTRAYSAYPSCSFSDQIPYIFLFSVAFIQNKKKETENRAMHCLRAHSNVINLVLSSRLYCTQISKWMLPFEPKAHTHQESRKNTFEIDIFLTIVLTYLLLLLFSLWRI